MLLELIFVFLFIFAATWAIMSLLWLALEREQKKHDEKFKTISKIVKENNLNREQAEKLYDLFIN